MSSPSNQDPSVDSHPVSSSTRRAYATRDAPNAEFERENQAARVNGNTFQGSPPSPHQPSTQKTAAHVTNAGLMLQNFPMPSSSLARPALSTHSHSSPSRVETRPTVVEQSTRALPEPSNDDTSLPRYSFDSDLRNYYRDRRHSLSEGNQASFNRTLLDPHRQDSSKTLVGTSSVKGKQRSFTRLLSNPWKHKPTISPAFNARHIHHVTYDQRTGRFLNLPAEWENSLRQGGDDRWGNLLANSTPESPTLYRTASLDDVRTSGNPYRLTLSSVADSLLTEESRYQRPAERPESFVSTTESIGPQVVMENGEIMSGPELASATGGPGSTSSPQTTTPRPLPHIPLP